MLAVNLFLFIYLFLGGGGRRGRCIDTGFCLRMLAVNLILDILYVIYIFCYDIGFCLRMTAINFASDFSILFTDTGFCLRMLAVLPIFY